MPLQRLLLSVQHTIIAGASSTHGRPVMTHTTNTNNNIYGSKLPASTRPTSVMHLFFSSGKTAS